MTVEDELLTLDALVKEKQDELNNINEDLKDYTGESVEPSEGEATE